MSPVKCDGDGGTPVPFIPYVLYGLGIFMLNDGPPTFPAPAVPSVVPSPDGSPPTPMPVPPPPPPPSIRSGKETNL